MSKFRRLAAAAALTLAALGTVAASTPAFAAPTQVVHVAPKPADWWL